MNNKHTYIAGGIAVLLVAGGAYYFLKDTGVLPNFLDDSTAASSTVQGAKETTLAVGEKEVPQPKNFDRALSYPASITADIKVKMQAAFEEDLKQIRASNDVNAWADLAVLRKITEDFKGSAEIWTYLSKRYTTYVGPYAALGDLYSNNIKDYPKAEANYLKAISLDPKNTDLYTDLYQLYRGLYAKTNTAAEDILKQGIAATGGVYQLHVELARYYVGKNRTAEAKTEYDAAIANAKVQGNTAAATQIEAEKAAL